LDGTNQAEQIGRQFFDGRGGNSVCVSHECVSQVMRACSMHTLRHPCRATESAAGLTDYMESTCIHSTTGRITTGCIGRCLLIATNALVRRSKY
jgi:hypothetical protein